jgi:competence protein ComEC
MLLIATTELRLLVEGFIDLRDALWFKVIWGNSNKVLSERHSGILFLISVIAFAAGVYIEAVYPVPLTISIILCVFFLCVIPITLRRTRGIATLMILICFILAGMVRLGVVTINRSEIESNRAGSFESDTGTDGNSHSSSPANDGYRGTLNEEMNIYEGLVTEASPSTKIIKLISPQNVRGLKIIMRTQDGLTINDRVKVFGYIKEPHLTFKNPSLTSWKWLKRLEGISYELKGTIISVTPGESYVEAWRRFLAGRIVDSGTEYAGIIKALTIGDITGIDEQTRELFLRTGTSHILAISGSNIGIVAAFFFFIARMFMRTSMLMKLRGDDRKYAALFSIPFAVLFMLTAGSSIPVIRATIMIIVYMLALYSGRTRHIENTVALSALIILMIYPHSIFMPTFQLTFASVFSIILFTKTFYPYALNWHPVLKWSFSSVLITVSAMIGTFPIVLYHFYGINPIAFIHNIIAVPLMCVVAMPLALTGMLAPYGEYPLRLSGKIISVTLYILNHLDRGYLYPLIRPVFFETIAYFIVIISLFSIKKRLIRFTFILILVPVLFVYSCTVVKERFYSNNICFNFIDVGLGDAILVEAPRGTRILIDGGGLYSNDFDMGKSVLTPVLLSKKVLSLDYVINTHPHSDHYGGLLYILNHFHVKRFITGTCPVSDPTYRELLRAAREKNIPVELWKRGDATTLNNGTELRILNPSQGLTIENLNNRSLVIKMRHGKNNFLLTGDIETSIEEELIFSHFPLRSDLLKIPHHGSRYSSSPYFLRATKPEIAVLSVGPGIKGIPSEETLKRYRMLSIPILRTDRDGFIRVCSDGERISYCTYK